MLWSIISLENPIVAHQDSMSIIARNSGAHFYGNLSLLRSFKVNSLQSETLCVSEGKGCQPKAELQSSRSLFLDTFLGNGGTEGRDNSSRFLANYERKRITTSIFSSHPIINPYFQGYFFAWDKIALPTPVVKRMFYS